MPVSDGAVACSVTPIIPESDPFRLDGQAAVLTGGLGRLGTQYARALTAAGASVALFDRTDRRSELLTSLIDAGARLSPHPADATVRAAVDAALADVVSRLGTPSIL